MCGGVRYTQRRTGWFFYIYYRTARLSAKVSNTFYFHAHHQNRLRIIYKPFSKSCPYSLRTSVNSFDFQTTAYIRFSPPQSRSTAPFTRYSGNSNTRVTFNYNKTLLKTAIITTLIGMDVIDCRYEKAPDKASPRCRTFFNVH